LYCAKGNFEFGISRIIKVRSSLPLPSSSNLKPLSASSTQHFAYYMSLPTPHHPIPPSHTHTHAQSLDPYDKKLHTDTWYYAKRCFLALAENMSKHMLILKDSSMDEILDFLDKAEAAGQNVMSVIGSQVDATEGEGASGSSGPATVSFEARQLKTLFLRLYDR
jgi:hypothetical protein